MRIIADENIPYVAEAFAAFGQVSTHPAAALKPELARQADLLLVRSVTRVDEGLLGDASVRFVGTATIGTDHVDEAFLARRNITFASAPGSNATSVSEWLTAALLAQAADDGLDLAGLTLGVIGVGNVGRRVAAKGRALGLRVLLNDPPRARAEGAAEFVELDRLLAESDLLTVHVPLIREGPDRTEGLADAGFFARLKPGARFFNSSRGRVVDEAALREARQSGRLAAYVLDVWRGEPEISAETLQLARLATPHIAGYSFDGKVAGTVMLRQAAARVCGLNPAWDVSPLLPAPETPRLAPASTGRREAILDAAVRQIYDLRADDRRLRAGLGLPRTELGALFTRLRKEYPRRREFAHTTVALPAGVADSAVWRGLGFAASGA